LKDRLDVDRRSMSRPAISMNGTESVVCRLERPDAIGRLNLVQQRLSGRIEHRDRVAVLDLAQLPDGVPKPYLFVSLWDSHAVAAIDIASRKVLANIQFPRGSGPKRILVAPKP
jgi:hypothetical protein